MERKFRVFDIEWDCDYEEDKNSLPNEIEVTITENDVDDINDQYDIDFYIENYISDLTGYCHYGFQLDELN